MFRLVTGLAEATRRAYRTLLPVSLRRGVRARLRPVSSGAVRPAVRRFDLALPSTGRTPAPRATIRIEAPRSLFIPKELERGGVAGYEPDTMAVLLALAEMSPAAIFDVGASVGPFALVAPALLDRPFVAFEPVPEVVDALRHIVAGNDLACTIEQLAVGDANGTATLYLSAASDASNSLRPDFRTATGQIEVPLTTLDAYAKRTGIWPGLLKIDTETTEPAVLRGAPEVLSRRPWIVCEVLAGWTEAELETLLGPLGYRFFQISDELPLTASEGIVGDPTVRRPNWLFAPSDPGPSLWASVSRWRTAIDAVGGPSADRGGTAVSGPRPATPPRSTYRRIRMTIGRLVHREAPGERTLRRRLIGQGASPQPRRPGDAWRAWVDAPLHDTLEVDRAVAEVEACGLPAHKDRPKNWDLLVALGAILERTTKTGSVLEMGATQYSRLLPWLYLYGYRHLRGIDLVYDGPIQLGPIRYEQMDLTATTYRDASFDAIACLSVIEHGVDLDAYLREAARLLRPGGILVTSTDFWCEPVDTRGQEAYGGPIRIFTPADIDRCHELAASHGLSAAGPIDFACDERVVHWDRFGLDYTFLNFILVRSGEPASPVRPRRSPG